MQLFRYFKPCKDIFACVSDFSIQSAEDFDAVKHLLPVAYNYQYYIQRIETEERMYKEFCSKGGLPQRRHPYYLTLGRCDEWFYEKKHCYSSVVFDLDEFNPKAISFTYGDSIPTYMDSFDDGKPYRKTVYTIHEIEQIINTYGLPQEWNTFELSGPENYIEAQVWCDNPISELRPKVNGSDSYISKVSSRMINACSFHLPQQLDYNYCETILMTSELRPWLEEVFLRIDRNLFPNDSVHGFEHGVKCALTALLLGETIKMDVSYLKTLMLAALLHDIGRTRNDGRKTHAEISAEIIQSSNIIDELDRKIEVADLVRYHNSIDTEQDPILLAWLKDIDSLDYVRMGCGMFNPNILRHGITKKLVQFIIELNIRFFINKGPILGGEKI